MALPAVGLLGTTLGAFLAFAISGIVARILLSLGMGIVTYVGITALFNSLVQQIHTQLGGIPSDLLHLVGLAGFDVFLSLIFSAHIGIISFLLAASGFQRLGFLKQEP